MKQTLLRRLRRPFSGQIGQFVQTGVLAVAAGLAAVAFLFLTNLLFSRTYMVFAGRSPLYFVFASFLVITATSLAVGYLLNVFSPAAAGSGIPQVKSAFWKEMGFIEFKTVLVKFVAGVLSIGGGNSLGREGPSVFLGGGVASNLAGFGGVARKERRGAILVGAAAGLAAAFNTPLAAITFVIEEITGDLNSRHLGRVVLAGVLGAFVVYALIGRQPAFELPAIEAVSWLHYAVVPLAAAAAALVGAVFQRSALYCRARLRKQRRLPPWALPVVGGWITWTVGGAIFVFTGRIGVFGLGYPDLSAVLRNDLTWWIAGILVAAKLVATVAGYSFGGCGGIFAPSLFLGGLTGYFVAGLLGLWLPLTPADHIVLAVVGMSSCLGTIVGAPLTSILIVFEMTHQFTLVPGLMLGAIVSRALSRYAGRHNFYDALLLQDGHDLHKIRPPLDLQSWRNLPTVAVANPHPVMLADLEPATMRAALEDYPYALFPLAPAGRPVGIVRREEMTAALARNARPPLHPLLTCFPQQTVGEIGARFVEASAHMLLVVEPETEKVVGIVTLHDLIRAQAAIQY